MRIIKFGELVFREGQGPIVQGWQVEREAADPVDATDEQLLLGFVVTWAKHKFDDAFQSAAVRGLIDAAARVKADLAAGK